MQYSGQPGPWRHGEDFVGGFSKRKAKALNGFKQESDPIRFMVFQCSFWLQHREHIRRGKVGVRTSARLPLQTR